MLYALRQKVGEATFQRIERAWVAEHRDSTAGTADFIRLASRVPAATWGPSCTPGCGSAAWDQPRHSRG